MTYRHGGASRVENYAILDAALVAVGSIIAFFVAKTDRSPKTKLGAVIAIAVPLLLLLTSQYLWVKTGNGLLETLSCKFVPSGVSCNKEKTDNIDLSKDDIAEISENASRSCSVIVFDVQEGTVNGLPISTDISTIKRELPCYSSAERSKESWMNQGGGVFFSSEELYWYTFDDPVSIDIGRQGSTNVLQTTQIVGRTVGELKSNIIGNWGRRNGVLTLDKKWGCLTFEFRGGIVAGFSAIEGGCDKVRLPR